MAAKKSLSTPKHRVRWLAWCKEKKGWTTEQWGHVLFSDESTFELIPDRRMFIRRRQGEWYHPDCVVLAIKHGGTPIEHLWELKKKKLEGRPCRTWMN